MNRQEKDDAVQGIRELLSDAQLVILTDYSGLDVSKMVSLRQEIRKSNGRYRIVKNTLAKIAIEETELSALSPHFKGPVAVAIATEDAAATAKAVVEFRKKHKALDITSGFLSGGKLLNEAELTALADLPSKDELRSMFLNTLLGVPRKMVTVLSAVPRDFVNVLNARKRELGGGDEAAA